MKHESFKGLNRLSRLRVVPSYVKSFQLKEPLDDLNDLNL